MSSNAELEQRQYCHGTTVLGGPANDLRGGVAIGTIVSSGPPSHHSARRVGGWCGSACGRGGLDSADHLGGGFET